MPDAPASSSQEHGLLARVLNWSLQHRFAVLFIATAIVVVGIYSMLHLPVDAFPDTTPVQVQINTMAPALSPLEIEQQITLPVEQAIGGLVGLTEVRSISKFGLSQVTVLFEDGVDIYFARQLVMERLQTIELPDGIERPEMGPVATGLGEVFHYIVTDNGARSLQELTTIHDWEIRPRLRSVPGVAEVNTWGGEKLEYQVQADLRKLIRHDLSLSDLIEALEENNLTVGGGNLVQAGEIFLVQGVSLTTTVFEIEDIVVAAYEGVPIRVRDVAKIVKGHEIRQGAVTANGKGEVVLGLGFMLMGQNSHDVTSRLRERLEEVTKNLPNGIEVRPVYDRTELVDQVLETVKENLTEGAILVIVVLLFFLGNLRAGLIVAATIPLAMLFAVSGMWQLGIIGSLMSLGAIDFGFIVDSTLIMVENNLRRLRAEAESRTVLSIVRDASLQVVRPTVFGQMINMIVYLPLLALVGVEGKMFRPMALTILMALSASVLFICTLVPVLVSLVLRRGGGLWKDRITPIFAFFYRPVLRLVLRNAKAFCFVPLVVAVGVVALALGTGSEFLPKLSEMSLVANAVRLSGVSLEESVRYGTQIEKRLLKEFPDEIADVWVRTGTAEVATDPMGIQISDIFITLKSREEWTRAADQESLTELMRQALEGMPGMNLVFTQPIEMRVNEMTAGIRTDIGIKIFGDDLTTLRDLAADAKAILEEIQGSADIYTEQITGQPVLKIRVDQDALARYGVPARVVMDVVEAIGSLKVGEIRDGQRRFALVVRLAEEHRKDPAAVGNILIPTADGQRIPLARLAHIEQTEGPAVINREWQKRRILVQCNVSGRDISGFVEEVRGRLDADLQLPPGYHIEFGGQFEHLQRARLRLAIVVPLALFLIFFLLYSSTSSVRDSIIIFMGTVFAALGGLIALHVRDIPFTISAGVGFVVVCGVSVLNGLILVATIKEGLASGLDQRIAIEKSALRRLRPIVMAGLVAALGFLPMALNTGVGAEVQRPLATVVIGGVIMDNLLTLLTLPALFATFGSARRQRSDREDAAAGS